MHINWQQKELHLKVVYYGPALSGKTTNLEQIYARVDPSHRSEMVSLKTHEDRTLYFDYLQLELGKISGLTPKILLYTVPGQAYYEASRKLVLRGADGVVFVADRKTGLALLRYDFDQPGQRDDVSFGDVADRGLYEVGVQRLAYFNRLQDVAGSECQPIREAVQNGLEAELRHDAAAPAVRFDHT